MNYENIEDVVRKENDSKKECICEWCNKPILLDLVNRTDVIYNGGSTIIVDKPYHLVCNKQYERIRLRNQLKNVLYMVFDRKTDFIDIAPLPISIPIHGWHHVNTMNYSFFISINKGLEYSIGIDLSLFPKFTDTFDGFDGMRTTKQNGKICKVYVKSHVDLISVLQRAIHSITPK